VRFYGLENGCEGDWRLSIFNSSVYILMKKIRGEIKCTYLEDENFCCSDLVRFGECAWLVARSCSLHKNTRGTLLSSFCMRLITL